MKVLIIEDEPLAADRLEQLIHQYEPHIQILDKLDSVYSVLKWFENNDAPSLIFMDIQLADGLSFEIFEHMKITSPIIFTTAYDEYAIRAFKVNSIDYLLKPLTFEDLAAALDKYNSIFGGQVEEEKSSSFDMSLIQQLLASMKNSQKYKDRFVVKRGEHLISLSISEILYFYAEDKSCLLRTIDGSRYLIDYTLAELESKLEPDIFFRLNRSFLARHEAIEDIVAHSHSRLRICLKYVMDEKIIVSKQRVGEFKTWLGG